MQTRINTIYLTDNEVEEVVNEINFLSSKSKPLKRFINQSPVLWELLKILKIELENEKWPHQVK